MFQNPELLFSQAFPADTFNENLIVRFDGYMRRFIPWLQLFDIDLAQSQPEIFYNWVTNIGHIITVIMVCTVLTIFTSLNNGNLYDVL